MVDTAELRKLAALPPYTGISLTTIAAADEIDRLRDTLTTVRSFLANKPWGTVGYMEGSEIYSDLRNQIAAIDAVLDQ